MSIILRQKVGCGMTKVIIEKDTLKVIAVVSDDDLEDIVHDDYTVLDYQDKEPLFERRGTALYLT